MLSVRENQRVVCFLMAALVFLPNTPRAHAQNLPPAPQFNQDEEDSPLLPPRDRDQNFPPVSELGRGTPEKRPGFTPNAQERNQGCRKLHDFIGTTIKTEKKSRTTSKNVKNRWLNIMRNLISLPKPDCVFLRQDIFDISDMLAKNLLKDAGRKLHYLISGLNPGEIDSCCNVAPRGDRQGSSLTLEQLAEQEKTSPTDVSNIGQRWRNLVQIAIKSGNPDKILPREHMDRILPTIRPQEQIKMYKKALLSASGSEAAQGRYTASPQNHRVMPSSAAVASSFEETDKKLALELFYRAMQYYAKGDLEKTRHALDQAHKLDPDNGEISEAVKRVGKDLETDN